MRLIEPDLVSGPRASGDGLTDLPRSQAVVPKPFKNDSCFAAVTFDFSFARRSENLLPGKVESFSIIADISHPFFRELLAKTWRDPPQDVTAVSYWSLPSALCVSNAVEPDLQRPGAGIGHFIVQRYGLISRVFG